MEMVRSGQSLDKSLNKGLDKRLDSGRSVR